jgi:hypothetical protein
MPASYTITFRPKRPLAPTGEQIRGLAAALIEPPSDPDHARQVQPFSVWPARFTSAQQDCFELRLNWLADDGVAADRLHHSLPRQQRLGAVLLDVVDVAEEVSTYETLCRLAPIWQCDFECLSPTYFSRSGRDYLLPDPELIVQRLVARWNEHNDAKSPLSIGKESAMALTSRVILKAHELRTVRLERHAGHQGTGFVGQVRLGLRNADRRSLEGQSAARLFAALCGFASFCGIGALTTHCLGAVATYPITQ